MNDRGAAYDSIDVVKMGMSLGDQGDLEGAQALFEKAINSPDPAAAGWAAWGLGKVFAGRGDPEAAKAWWCTTGGRAGAWARL